MRPGHDALVEIAARTLPLDARIVDLGGPQVPSTAFAGRRVTRAHEHEWQPLLADMAREPVDAILVAWPTSFAPLMPLLAAIRGALHEDGAAIACDLVWQTAPTPELMRAFAPPAGREKVRPIEGWEMQAEHSGLEIVERGAVDRSRWIGALGAEQRAAVEADARGAARLATWVMKPSAE